MTCRVAITSVHMRKSSGIIRLRNLNPSVPHPIPYFPLFSKPPPCLARHYNTPYYLSFLSLRERAKAVHFMPSWYLKKIEIAGNLSGITKV